MRLAFLGSAAFAVPALQALAAAGHQLVAVYCQPPRPGGRGHHLRPCPVHTAATALGLAVRTPERLRQAVEEHAAFAALDLDAAVVCAYGLLLPLPMLAAPRLGCFNIHASLLPRWRGAAPIQAAILAGDRETGISIMRMDEGLDTGPVLLQQPIPIAADETAASLHERLAPLGAELILRALAEQPPPRPQPPTGATYAPKLSRADSPLDWRQTADVLERRVRALNPWPGTTTTAAGVTLKVLAARAEAGSGPPGTVLDDEALIACGEGALRLLVLQLPGRAALAAPAFLRGHPLPAGSHLGP